MLILERSLATGSGKRYALALTIFGEGQVLLLQKIDWHTVSEAECQSFI